MKIVITHTDLRIYWPARIAALQEVLAERGDELWVVEIAGAGSPYAFASQSVRPADTIAMEAAAAGPASHWICLFPEARMEDIDAGAACRKLYITLSKLNPDVVMSGSFAFPSGATAIHWAKSNLKAVVLFDDARPHDVVRSGLVNYIKRLLYKQVDAMLCPAEPWKEAMGWWGLKPEQIFTGVDVVDNGFWAQTPEDYMPSEPFLLAVGRQIPAKNFVFLLKAYAQYQQQQRDALPLVFVGEGPEREKMETFVYEQELKQVHFLPFADASTLRRRYHQAAALVLPSHSETWGLVVNEAMAAGLPVLASKACGCASVLIQDGVNGYTFSPGEEEQLLRALLRFSKLTPAARKEMGMASARRIADWGLERFANGSVEAIDYAMENKKECSSLLARWLMKKWKGRYRPV